MTILLIAGHGKQRDGSFDPGAKGYISRGEHKYMTDNLFPAMKKYLPKGSNVVFYTEKKVSNHGNLVQLVRQYKATKVIEFHYDAHTLGSSARGGHVIVHSNVNPNKLDLSLRDVIEDMVGVRYTHRGHKGISGRNNLYNVNIAAQNKIDYRLLELGFGTNKTDSDIMVKQVDEYAKKLVEAITGQINTKPVEKPTVKPTEKPKEQNKPVTKPETNKKPSPTKPVQNTNNNKGSGRVLEILVVDGERGKKTIRRWQQFLGTPVDGVISKPTSTAVKAWQRFLNKYAGAKLVVDGIEGPATIRAGQRFFKTPVDGKISRSSLYIKELQRFLNTYGR